MEPTINLFDHQIDIYTHYRELSKKYVRATRCSGLKRIVHPSSIGGHSDTGTGMLAFHYHARQTLKQLPEAIAITTWRPGRFYDTVVVCKSLAGRSPQQQIQDKGIGKAREKLSTTNLSVSEIAYGLGFAHPRSLRKLLNKRLGYFLWLSGGHLTETMAAACLGFPS